MIGLCHFSAPMVLTPCTIFKKIKEQILRKKIGAEKWTDRREFKWPLKAERGLINLILNFNYFKMPIHLKSPRNASGTSWCDNTQLKAVTSAVLFIGYYYHEKIWDIKWFLQNKWMTKKSCNLIGRQHFVKQNFPIYRVCTRK